MKFSIGYAKNEAYELILGDCFIAIGGVLLGLLAEHFDERTFLVPFCIGIFVLGAIFDIRSIRKFTFELNKLKSEINSANDKLNKTIHNLDQHETQINSAKKDLNEATHDLKQTKLEVDKTISELKKIEQKVFGTSSNFSKFNWAHPMEDKFKEIERKFEQLKRDFEKFKSQFRR